MAVNDAVALIYHAMVRRPHRFVACTILAAACTLLHAAELGDVRVASHSGQPLVADIELSMLDDPATPVTVRLASPEVYSGAGIAVPAVLSSLNLAVMRRDGRQFLHVTSLRPVDADHVHLYLELVDKGQRAVRLATLWLTPDPSPVVVAPPVVAAAVPAALAASVAAPAPAAARGAASARASAPVAPAMPAHVPVHVPSPVRAPMPARAHGEAAVAAPAPAPIVVKPARPAVLAKPVPAAAVQPPACVRQPDEAQACTVLGAKNADLRAQLVRLEDKVKGLQARLGVTPADHVLPPSPLAAMPGARAASAPAASASAAGESPASKPAASELAASESAASKPAAGAPVQPAPATAPEHANAGAGDAAPGKPEPAPEETRPPVPAVPKPIRSIKTLVPHKAVAPADDDSLPWGWVGAGAGLLALAGAGTALLAARRKKSRNVDIPGDPGMFDRLKRRLAARRKSVAPAPAPAAPLAEPVLAEPTPE
jgi:hypothetical protein